MSKSNHSSERQSKTQIQKLLSDRDISCKKMYIPSQFFPDFFFVAYQNIQRFEICILRFFAWSYVEHQWFVVLYCKLNLFNKKLFLKFFSFFLFHHEIFKPTLSYANYFGAFNHFFKFIFVKLCLTLGVYPNACPHIIVCLGYF